MGVAQGAGTLLSYSPTVHKSQKSSAVCIPISVKIQFHRINLNALKIVSSYQVDCCIRKSIG